MERNDGNREENKKEENKEVSSQENGRPRSSYTKGQRICAMVMAVLLLAMYGVTLVAGLTTSPKAPEFFKMSVGASILLPIVFWCHIRFARLFGRKRKKQFTNRE